MDSTSGDKILHFALLTGIGTLQNIAKKILYQMSSVGVGGVLKKFEKPWFVMLMMFISCSCVLLLYFCKILYSYILSTPEDKPKIPKIKLKTFFQLIIPTLLDLIASVMINVALVWISVSVTQMIRSFGVIFTGLFTVIYRKRKLFRFEYAGGVMIILSVILLGMVELMNDDNEDKHINAFQIIFGIFLIIGGQALRAFQSIIEEELLHDVVIPPFFIVGVQGVWGFLITGLLCFPVLYLTPFPEGTGLHEDIFDCVTMVHNSTSLLFVLVFYAVLSGLGSLNYLLVMDLTNALTADVISLLRNLLVWIFAVVIHYTVAPSYGEGLGLYSLVELLGFIVMVFGIFVFRGSIPLGWLSGSSESDAAVSAASASLRGMHPHTPPTPVLVESAEGELINVSRAAEASQSDAAARAARAAGAAAAAAAARVEEALTEEAKELRAEYTEIEAEVGAVVAAASDAFESAAAEPAKLWKSVLLFAAMIAISTLQNVSKKVAFQMSAVGLDGVLRKFEKPWFLVWMMFIAEGCVVLFYLGRSLIGYLFSTPEERLKIPNIKLMTYFQLILPTLCDLISSVMINVALIWISVSVCQMVRSMGVVFTGIFTILVRKRKLFKFEYFGSLVIVLSVVLLGVAEVMDSNEGLVRITVGILFIVIGQAFHALQSITEEGLLRDVVVPPFFIVGVQGVWGFVLTTVVFFPLLYYVPFPDRAGLHEDFFDTVAMLKDNTAIPLLLICYAVLSGCGSLVYLLVMELTNALTADVISLLRSVFVWVLAVGIHYTVGTSFGEGLGNRSLVQLLGFVVMFLNIFYKGGISIGWLPGASKVPVAFPLPADEPFVVDGAAWEDRAAWSSVGVTGEKGDAAATAAAATHAAVEAAMAAALEEEMRKRAGYEEIKAPDALPAPVPATSPSLSPSSAPLPASSASPSASLTTSTSASQLSAASPSASAFASRTLAYSASAPQLASMSRGPKVLVAVKAFLRFMSPGDGMEIAVPESGGSRDDDEEKLSPLPTRSTRSLASGTPEPAVTATPTPTPGSAATAATPGSELSPGLLAGPVPVLPADTGTPFSQAPVPVGSISPAAGRGQRRGPRRQRPGRGRGGHKRSRRGEAAFPGTVTTVTLVRRALSSANLAVFASANLGSQGGQGGPSPTAPTPRIWGVERETGKGREKEKEKEKEANEGEGEKEPLLK